VLLGYLGVHRFYVGKIATGVIWLLTGGLFGIGYIVDIIVIALGNFTDIDGNRLVFWD
jgi:TM2 domain-containing membrane protein YozV